MDKISLSWNRDTPSTGSTWKEAVVAYQEGDNPRRLLAEVLSPEEIFVIAMRPPCLRDIVKITFTSEEGGASREVEALVTEVSYRPTDVRRCGFVATVTRPESLFSYPPVSPIRNVDVLLANPTAEEKREKRRDPRIRTKVLGAVYLPGRTLTTRILNLSMSGALLGFDRDQIPPEMTLGVLFRMDAYDSHGDVSLAVKGEIIRLIGVGRPTNAGVRFIDIDADARAGIETIILSEIHAQQIADGENGIAE
jgi:hypothetical protein